MGAIAGVVVFDFGLRFLTGAPGFLQTEVGVGGDSDADGSGCSGCGGD